MNVKQIYPNIDTGIYLQTPNKCAKFLVRSDNTYASYSNFLQSVWKEEKDEEIFMKICRLISQKQLEGSY